MINRAKNVFNFGKIIRLFDSKFDSDYNLYDNYNKLIELL